MTAPERREIKLMTIFTPAFSAVIAALAVSALSYVFWIKDEMIANQKEHEAFAVENRRQNQDIIQALQLIAKSQEVQQEILVQLSGSNQWRTYVDQQIIRQEERTEGRYSSSDAERDQKLLIEKIGNLSNVMSRVEVRVARIENR